MSKIKIEVLQPNKIKIKDEYDHVIVPGTEGDFGVSEEHTPFITKMRPGILKLYKGNQEERYAIHDGFVTVENNVVTIVCDTIEKEDELIMPEPKHLKNRAEKRLKSAEEKILILDGLKLL